ncbi:integrase [Caulobacter sp. S45]|uniref:integrase n=1 Tax=Caulobacter sp. S45 TaxID=1641861 RepID=UPI001575D8BF|nr:integrase [Caulobacter sp. S45]
MTMMVKEVYDALLAAGAPEDKAARAAQALAGNDNRFNKVESDLTLLKWMVGLVMAGIVALITKTFF